MAESYSVQAVLSAVDNGFSRAMGSAANTTRSLSDTIKGTALGMGLFKVAGAAVNAFTSSLDGAIDRYDTMNNFPKIMSNLGISAGDSEKAVAKLSDKLTGLPTTLDSAASGVTNFTSKNGDIQKSTDYFLAMNNAILAGGKSTQVQGSAIEQLSQAYSKGKMDMIEWRSLQTAMPAQLKQVATAMGMTTDALGEGLRSGEVSMDSFMDTIVKLNQEGVEGFASFEEQAKSATGGIKTAMTNLNTSITRGVTSCIGAFDQLLAKNNLPTIGETINKAGSVIGKGFEAIQTTISKIDLGGIVEKWKTFTSAISETGAFSSLKNALSDIGSAFKNVFSALTDSGILETIGTAIGKIVSIASKAVSAVAGFVAGLNPSTIKGIAGAVLGLVGGFKALNVGVSVLDSVKNFNPFKMFKKNTSSALGETGTSVKKSTSTIAQIITSLGKVIQSVGSGISTAAKGIGTGLKSAFQGIGSALKIANPVNILALGAAIGIVVAAMTLLATQGQGVATIIEGVGTAIAIVVSAVGGVIVAILTALIPYVGQIAVLIQAAGEAFALAAPGITALGEALSLVIGTIGTAVTSVVEVLTPIVEIIAGIFIAIAQVIGETIVGIMEVLAPFAPAFFEAFTQCTQIVSDAVVQIVEALAPYMPSIQAMVEATSTSIQAVCTAFVTLVSAIAPVISSVTELVGQLGDSITQIFEAICEVLSTAGTTISEIVGSIGEAISEVVETMGGAMAEVLQGVADVITSIGEAALNAGEGFSRLAEGVSTITELNLFDMGASLAAVATGIGAIALESQGLSEAASGMQGLVTSISSVSTVLAGFTSSVERMSSIATSVKTSIDGIKNAFAGFVLPPINVGPVVSSLVAITTAATMMAANLKIAGVKATTGFTASMKSGFNQVPQIAIATMSKFNSGISLGMTKAVSTARSASTSIASALRSSSASAYNSGLNIGLGLANGMRSTLGTVRAVAAQLASAADAAIRAKAQIHSPSRVSTKLGKYWGEGYVNGIKEMVKDAWDAAKDLVSVPSLARDDLHLSVAGYNGSLSEEFNYNSNLVYDFNITMEADGRELAKATATYTQEELDKLQRQNNRKAGVR